MNNNKEFDLLSDIAKLIKKYGPETFEALGEQITNPKFTIILADLLSTTAKTYRATPKAKSRSRSKPQKGNFLSRLEESDPEKAALLIELYDSLKNRSILPTLREMRDFATDNGLPTVKSTSREKALIPFVRTFLKMPAEELREYLRRIQPTRSSGDRTLEGWSKIIFGKDVKDSVN
ncbi:MAG: hypothetical protein LC795_07840 [Acidobacteria bacterium]|nr:hypothetical protein [Acidobacteriota bacterium]